MRRPAAADRNLGALLLARLQHADDLVALPFCHNGTDGGGGIVGVADGIAPTPAASASTIS